MYFRYPKTTIIKLTKSKFHLYFASFNSTQPYDQIGITLILFIQMIDSPYPHPPSHKTFEFGHITFDSDFDSGNLYNVEKISNNNYNLWIAVDHPKNQYRSWFHFSIKGLNRGTIATFNIKNMQNQSRLLNQGLVPVYREQSSKEWKRIIHKIDLSKIQYNEGWIEWSFKHTVTSNQKVFFAFFYPWSNTENDLFLKQMEEKCQLQADAYFKRSTIIKTLEGRPVDFITISSKKWITNKNQKIQDQNLFKNGSEPRQFGMEKKCIIISARVHPGQVPSSHVMTGIIKELVQDSEKGRLLRDKFVFYLIPILNPDGVARGHYRVDTNGINLNRCYINPSPKNHSPIYAIKKIITHFHSKGKYFGFLDLHAHAAHKGVFIYGNSTNELDKQVEICLFPKILSMNSEIFEYEGSNFTEKNMYYKDINDHVSKEGAGRVALFKATKNPYSWTLECNYNTSRVLNKLQERRQPEDVFVKPNQKQLQTDLIINYKYPTFNEVKEFYTIQHFHQLGKQICQSFLDLVELNPQSRIDNFKSRFKSIQNLKLNLAVALLRMAPNRFQLPFKKIYHCIQGPSSTRELSERGVKALYLMLIKKARIQNMGSFLKYADESSVVFPVSNNKKSISPIKEHFSAARNIRTTKSNGNDMKISAKVQSQYIKTYTSHKDKRTLQNEQSPSKLRLMRVTTDNNQIDSEDSEADYSANMQIVRSSLPNFNEEKQKNEAARINAVLNAQMLEINFSSQYQGRPYGKQSQFNIQNLRLYRKSFNVESKKVNNHVSTDPKRTKAKLLGKELPTIMSSKIKAMISNARHKAKHSQRIHDLLHAYEMKQVP